MFSAQNLPRMLGGATIFPLGTTITTVETRKRFCWGIRPKDRSCSRTVFAETQNRQLLDVNEKQLHNTVKRKVALHLGYVGTGFKGLQKQSNTAAGETIEDELEKAVHKTGGILDTNLGKHTRLKWSRSSRTDKGVHSLATVISLMLECQDEAFVSDSEGTLLANRINLNLPPQVRVMSVQRVNNSFNARTECHFRTYHYYLPAHILGDDHDGSKLMALEACWRLFQGHHPFHNYTKRRLYRDQVGVNKRRSKGRSEEDEEVEEEEEMEDATNSDPNSVDTSGPPSSKTAPSHSAGGTAAALSNQTTSTARPDKNVYQARWNDVIDPADRVTIRHYRHMGTCEVEGPVELTPGGVPAYRLAVTGSSFMLYQIRHIVAAAVAVAQGMVPLDFIAATLAAPSRAVLPLAPPSTLVLHSNTFHPFPTGGSPSPAVQLTGERLTLREAGKKLRDDFAQQMVYPAVSSLLDGAEWDYWKTILLRTSYDDAQVQHLIRTHQQWEAQRSAARASAAGSNGSHLV